MIFWLKFICLHRSLILCLQIFSFT